MSLRAQFSASAEPLYLMDGSAFIYRGFYAFQNMARSDGFPTNAIYIVARLLLRIIREERPRYFAFILDGKGAGFRHDLLPSYKAQRSKTPEPLIMQLEPLLRLIESLGLPYYVSENFEADDYIASLAKCHSAERPVVIIGADKDLKQCLNEQVVLWDPAGKNEKILSLQGFREETGMEPSSWPDYQALIGDSSDNIPGVPQIGPKTALGLMQDFPSLEELFSRLPAVPPKVRSKLEGQQEAAMLYRELTRLRTDLCQEISLEGLQVKDPAFGIVQNFMNEFELRSLAAEVASMQRVGGFSPLKSNGDKVDALQVPKAMGSTVGQKQDSLPLANAAGQDADKSVSALQENMAQAGANHAAQVQGSLFDAAPVQISRSLPTSTTINFGTAEQVAVLNLPTGLVVAFAGTEVLYTGPVTALAEQLNSSTCVLVTADVKALATQHPEFWSIEQQRWFDLSLAAHLLSPEERSYAWDALVSRWQYTFDTSMQAEVNPGKVALSLYAEMQQRLTGAALMDVFKTLETPLIPVLGKMQERGIGIDQQAFAEFLVYAQEELDRLTALIHEKAGRVFNIRSSQQLSDVLFVVLGLPKAGKTRGGATSTAQEALEKLSDAHPIVQDILDYRKLEKLRSTYLEPLPRLADGNMRVHTTFNQFATATGRLSSSNPNLQNIPIRGSFGGRMRDCFVAGPGNLLVCADYSQIELRVLAHFSEDPTLLEAFHKNEDIHTRTAALIFETPAEQVKPEQRRNAKTINFGLIYGMGAQKLGQELKISMKEAKAFMEKYFEKLSKLKEFYDQVEEDAKEFGYVATITGRRRFTPDILSQNNQLRSQARRQAINARIQGSAADIIKLAMLNVEADHELQSLGAELIMQVHDELILEVPEANAKQAGERLAMLMRDVQPGGTTLSVPLLVDMGIGKSWGQAH